MRVRLNLATKAQETHRRFMVVAGFVAAVAGIIFLAFGWHVYSVRNVDARMRAQSEATSRRIEELQAERTDLERFFAQPENAKLHDRAAFLNSLIDGRSFNWTQMFMDLEKILPTGVRLVSIDPAHDKGQVLVKLQVGAISDDAKLKFVRALESSPAFKEVREISEKYAEPQPGSGDLDRVQIQLTVVYVRS